MRRTTLLLAAGLAFLAALPDARAEPLVVSTNNTPLDRKALEILSTEVFRRAGLEIRFVSNPSERSLQMADRGEVDGEGLRVAGLAGQYPNLVPVPERFIGISFVAFSKDARIVLDKGWESLKPYRVAHIAGWKLFEANATSARSVAKVDRPEQLFRMLDGGRIDLALYTRADGVALIREMGLDTVAPLMPALKDVDMFLYLHRRHADHAPRLAAALREMKADGTYNRLLFAVLSP